MSALRSSKVYRQWLVGYNAKIQSLLGIAREYMGERYSKRDNRS